MTDATQLNHQGPKQFRWFSKKQLTQIIMINVLIFSQAQYPKQKMIKDWKPDLWILEFNDGINASLNDSAYTTDITNIIFQDEGMITLVFLFNCMLIWWRFSSNILFLHATVKYNVEYLIARKEQFTYTTRQTVDSNIRRNTLFELQLHVCFDVIIWNVQLDMWLEKRNVSVRQFCR